MVGVREGVGERVGRGVRVGNGVHVGSGVREGVIVTDVQRGSPAATGGLRAQDIITRINDTEVEMGGDLRRVLRGLKPGDEVQLAVVRPPNGARATVTVRLGLFYE